MCSPTAERVQAARCTPLGSLVRHRGPRVPPGPARGLSRPVAQDAPKNGRRAAAGRRRPGRTSLTPVPSEIAATRPADGRSLSLEHVHASRLGVGQQRHRGRRQFGGSGNQLSHWHADQARTSTAAVIMSVTASYRPGTARPTPSIDSGRWSRRPNATDRAVRSAEVLRPCVRVAGRGFDDSMPVEEGHFDRRSADVHS